MYDFIKSAGTVLLFLAAGFYAFMYFRAGAVEFPYHLLPDAVKLDRMIAAELMQCALHNPDTAGIARWGIGMAPTETAAFLAQATLRSEIIEARDTACAAAEEAQKSGGDIIDNQHLDKPEGGVQSQQQYQGMPNQAPTVSAAIGDITIVNEVGSRQVSLSGVFDDPEGDSLTITLPLPTRPLQRCPWRSTAPI